MTNFTYIRLVRCIIDQGLAMLDEDEQEFEKEHKFDQVEFRELKLRFNYHPQTKFGAR